MRQLRIEFSRLRPQQGAPYLIANTVNKGLTEIRLEGAVQGLFVIGLCPGEEVRSRVDVVHRLGALVRHVSGNAANHTRSVWVLRNRQLMGVFGLALGVWDVLSRFDVLVCSCTRDNVSH